MLHYHELKDDLLSYFMLQHTDWCDFSMTK